MIWLIVIVAALVLIGVAFHLEWNRFLMTLSILILIPSGLVCLIFSQKEGLGTTSLISGCIAIVQVANICKILYRCRCPYCRKFFKARMLGRNLVHSTYSEKVYRREYICNECGKSWSRDYSERKNQ